MARRTRIKPQTYWRLERGLTENPPIRYLVNCAAVLECRLEDVCEGTWLAWTESFEALDGASGRSRRS